MQPYLAVIVASEKPPDTRCKLLKVNVTKVGKWFIIIKIKGL